MRDKLRPITKFPSIRKRTNACICFVYGMRGTVIIPVSRDDARSAWVPKRVDSRSVWERTYATREKVEKRSKDADSENVDRQ